MSGEALTIKLWTHRNAASEIEVWRGTKIGTSGEDGLYYDQSVRPFLRNGRNTILVAYAANPGAGSGQYASIWKISKRGQKLEWIGAFRNADLRQWFKRGIVREIRPAKYATDDLWRALPNLWQDERYVDRKFILRYRFDRQAEKFRFVGYRIVPQGYLWPKTVRLPPK